MAISYQPNNLTRQLFIKRHRDFLKQVLAIIFALLLLVMDSRYPNNPIRIVVGEFASVIQIVVTRPVVWFFDIKKVVFQYSHLEWENQQLQQKILSLEAQLRQKQLQVSQYRQLKLWLGAHHANLKFAEAANLLWLQVDSNRQIYILDKGRAQGVFEGQVAVDGRGVIGQIIDVGQLTSTLLLISDSKCAVPVINQRTGDHGVVVGHNQRDELQLANILKTSTVRVGDRLLTSGLGLVYPFGIPVGIVKSVTQIPGEDFLKVIVVPAAHINQHHMVVLLESFAHIKQWQDELANRITVLDESEQ